MNGKQLQKYENHFTLHVLSVYYTTYFQYSYRLYEIDILLRVTPYPPPKLWSINLANKWDLQTGKYNTSGWEKYKTHSQKQ